MNGQDDSRASPKGYHSSSARCRGCFVLAATSCILLLAATPGVGASGRLVCVDDQALFLVTGATRQLVKKLEPGTRFQGFGLVDTNEAFLAYSTPGAEAGAVLAVWDAQTGTEYPIYELGGTGASEFRLNCRTKWVVFRWYDGIYVFSLANTMSELRSGTFDHRRFKGRIHRVVACQACDDPRWAGPNRITYSVWDGSRWKDQGVDFSPDDLQHGSPK